MIRDFSNTFDGKQAVMVRPLRISGSRTVKKIMGGFLVGTMLIGLLSSVAFTFLIRSGLNDLALRQNNKIELLKVQQGLYQQRKTLLEEGHILKMAGRLGLYSPVKRQVVSRF
jgi:hypothetical protein